MLWKGFQRPKRLEFERETLTDRFGRFHAQPFERGFGTTVGNALRRVLLSSIEGAAVTAVKIDGVLHEFSPIPGVVEDATDIILNIKQVPLKMHTDATKTLYLPVKKVNYLVEAARLGQTTDYDKLTVDIWTNGSVTPRDAISLSAKLVRDHLNIFINLDESADEQTDAHVEQQQTGSLNENLDKSVEELELSVRSYNCLKNANIRTIRELVLKTEGEMLKTKNFGRKSLNEIKEILQTMGLGLGMRVDQPASASQE